MEMLSTHQSLYFTCSHNLKETKHDTEKKYGKQWKNTTKFFKYRNVSPKPEKVFDYENYFRVL